MRQNGYFRTLWATFCQLLVKNENITDQLYILIITEFLHQILFH
jgi:hypothetical protein